MRDLRSSLFHQFA